MALYPPSIRKMINFSWGSSRQQVPALLLVKRGLEVWYLGRGHGNTQYLSWYLHHDIFMSDIFMSNIRQSPTVHYRLGICQNEYLCSHFLGVNFSDKKYLRSVLGKYHHLYWIGDWLLNHRPLALALQNLSSCQSKYCKVFDKYF